MEERKDFLPLQMTIVIAMVTFSLVGVADLAGWLPTSRSSPEGHFVISKSASNGSASPAPVECRDCGVIESIQEVSIQDKSSGIGAITGGVIGGILGHQIGGGVGKDLATIGGAAGGAYLGNEMEKNSKRRTVFRIVVRMSDGTHRVIHSSSQNFNIGQKVKVLDGKIAPVSDS